MPSDRPGQRNPASTYSFVNNAELLELLSQSCLLGVPGKATANSLVESGWVLTLLALFLVFTHPINSFVVEVILIAQRFDNEAACSSNENFERSVVRSET